MKRIFNFREIFPIIVAALFIAFIITLQFPLEIYWNNIQEFSVKIDTFIPIFSIAFVNVFLVFFLPGLFPYTTFRERYFSFIATLGLLIWFNANFMFGNYGAFDERGLVIDITTVRAISEAIIWVLLLALSIIFSPKIKNLQFKAVSGLLILSVILTCFQTIQHYLKQPSLPESSNAVFSEEYLTFSTEKNVIHFVLDELQTTLTEKLLEENPLYREKLDGFIFYPNTSSIYTTTLTTIPVLLSGHIYRNEKNKEQFATDVFADNAFTETLQNANYRVDTHTVSKFCVYNDLINCHAMPPKPNRKTSLTLLDYSFFKGVPDVIKPKIYRKGRWWLTDRFIVQDHNSNEPGVGHLLWTDFNENFKVAEIPPTYKFYHTFIPHAPTVLDAECNLLLQRAKTKSFLERKKQCACAFKHIFNFIDKLKRLGIYDNTMIIISSDHGSIYFPKGMEEKLIALNMETEPYPKALATLFIKPFNAHGPLEVSLAPASLADIPNTIITHLDLPALENGQNVLALTEDENREREFLYYDPTLEYLYLETLPPITVYTISGDIRNPQSWSYKETYDGIK